MSRHEGTKARRHEGGRIRAFSLLELVMILAIVATLAGIAAPRYMSSIANYRADAAVKRIGADLEYAAHLAKLTSSEITVEFEKSDTKNYYTFKNFPDPTGAPGDYRVHLWNEPYEAWMYDAPGDIKFDLYGMPDKTVTLWVRVGTNVERSVSVDETTGAITIP